MAVNIIQAKKTYLKSALSASASQVVLRYLKDAKGNDLAMSDFGTLGVIVVRQGDTTEMIKFNNVVIGSDGRATLTVDTNGRNLSPKPPYAGSATGESFQPGASVIITNDPWTTSQFAVLGNANVWNEEQTFVVSPSIPDGTDPDHAVNKGQLDDVAGDIADLQANKAPINSPAFTGTPTAPTPTTAAGLANKSFVEYIISQYSLGQDLNFRDVDITYDGEGNISTITDNELLLVYAVTWDSNGNPTSITETLNGVLQYTYTLTWNSNGQLTSLTRTP